MKTKKRSAGFGAALILLALLLRLVEAAPGYAIQPKRPDAPIARRPVAGLSAPPAETVPPTSVLPTVLPTQPAPTLPGLAFGPEDAALLRCRVASDCGYDPDLQALLQQPLLWDLSGDAPTVLIYHSHACESYSRGPGQNYTELPDCRTRDENFNMVAVGRALAQRLEQAGICVIHDRQLHDGPSYNQAYHSSRASVEDYLRQYPSIRLVLDLHRDAATNPDGSRYATSATVDGATAAQIMFVVGTDYTGSTHPSWQDNLALALKLQVLLERRSPGITRPVLLRGSRFNQDVSTGALIIEVGASGNTQDQALRTIPILAEAILLLVAGANL